MTGARLRIHALTITALALAALALVLGPQGQDLVRIALGITVAVLLDAAIYIRDMHRSHRADIQALCAEIAQLEAGPPRPEVLLGEDCDPICVCTLSERCGACRIRTLEAALECERAAVHAAYDHARTLRLEDALGLLDAVDGITREARPALSPAQLETERQTRVTASVLVQARRWAARAKTAEATVEAVRDDHHEAVGYCPTCDDPWPCEIGAVVAPTQAPAPLTRRKQSAYNAVVRRAEIAEIELRTLREGLREMGGDPTQIQNLWAQIRLRNEQWKEAKNERDTACGAFNAKVLELETAQAAIARVRRHCHLTISSSVRVHAVQQARDALATLNQLKQPTT